MPPPLSLAARRLRRGTLACLALAGFACAAAPAAALASTQASLHASFSADRLGAETALTVAMRFSGGPDGVPLPLRAMTIRMPAGLGFSLRGAATCSPARLRSRGAAACPPGSLLGRGHARLEVHAGSQTIPEQATLWALRGRNGAGAQTLEIFGAGSTPLDERSLSIGLLHPDSAPFGSRLAVSIPRIPTVELEPDASFDSLSLTLGAAGPPRAHGAGAHIRVPRRCPAGGFPFAAALTFADGSRANAAAMIACP